MSDEPIQLRTAEEIQRAHDLLWPLVTGNFTISMSKEDQRSLHAALDVLCWCLHHDHSDGFPKTMASIEAELAARGIVLRKGGDV